MSLRDRCQAFLDIAMRKAIMRTGSPADDLMEFVVSEIGRDAGDGALDETLPLCLYFADKEGRDEFVRIVLKEHPNMRSKVVP